MPSKRIELLWVLSRRVLNPVCLPNSTNSANCPQERIWTLTPFRAIVSKTIVSAYSTTCGCCERKFKRVLFYCCVYHFTTSQCLILVGRTGLEPVICSSVEVSRLITAHNIFKNINLCEWWDLNSQVLLGHTVLNRACLPVSTHSHIYFQRGGDRIRTYSTRRQLFYRQS